MSSPTDNEITFVVIAGEEIPIHSPKLDDFMDADTGDLVLPTGDGRALVISGWRDEVRRVTQ